MDDMEKLRLDINKELESLLGDLTEACQLASKMEEATPEEKSEIMAKFDFLLGYGRKSMNRVLFDDEG